MKYFLIAGEASGDLHASNLMRALRDNDPDARFFFFGGDMMSSVGGIRLRHYKSLAYMGFVPVLLHLPVIFKGLHECKRAIRQRRPDVVILVDYPGFNLKIARYVKSRTDIPVYYYIAPKIWAWKEWRIRDIRRDVAELFSILPFEKIFFEQKHNYPIHYVGNPTVDEVSHFKENYNETFADFAKSNGLHTSRPIIALLAGSRRQEIRDNLLLMCRAAEPYVDKGHQLVIAGAPAIEEDYYETLLSQLPDRERLTIGIVYDRTYPLLTHAKAALVTSGTATLETALFSVPQVVCYYTILGKFISFLRSKLLKVPYISLVNLVCNREVVPELVADSMTEANVRRHLGEILYDTPQRKAMLEGYARMVEILGEPGASSHAAREMLECLKGKND